MKILDMEQNSSDWFKARCGIPTASNFDCIITTKGEPSKQRTKYMYRLAGERITGIQEETYQNGNMVRGIEMEETARELYQLITGETIVKVGLCITEGNTIYAASPDGLVKDNGCIEIKCPILSTHVDYLLKNELPLEYFQQTQGQLLVTGRDWVDFVSFYPGMKPLIIRCFPDVKFQKALKVELELFCAELVEVVEKIR